MVIGDFIKALTQGIQYTARFGEVGDIKRLCDCTCN